MGRLDDLRAECKRLGLPTSGTVAVLESRLAARRPTGDDDGPDDILGLGDTGCGQPRLTLLQGLASNPTPASMAKPKTSPRGVVRYSYPCPGHLATQTHIEFCAAARTQAEDDGYAPKGGGYRVGFEHVDGVRHAVYEVTIRKR